MSRLQLKRDLIDLLAGHDLATVTAELPRFPRAKLVNALFSLLCHPTEQVRWHAVSCFGIVVPALAAADLEAARVVMRRCLWMLNDESGGIGWGVPEALGEIMAAHERLRQEYLHMLVSYARDDGPELFQDGNFLELEPLQEGVLWGLCRVAPVGGDMLRKHRVDENLAVYFSSLNSQVKGLVCRLAGLLRLGSWRASLAGASTDSGRVRIYQAGVFTEYTVGDLAREALARM